MDFSGMIFTLAGYCSICSITIDDVVFVVDAGKVKEKVMYVAVVFSNSK